MSAIISDKFRIFNAENFLQAIGTDFYDTEGTLQPGDDAVLNDERHRMYFFVGRPQPWYALLEIYSRVDAGTGWDGIAFGDTVEVGAGPDFEAAVVAVYEDYVLLQNVTGTLGGVNSAPPEASTITVTSGAATGSTGVTGLYRYATEDVPTLAFDNEAEFYDVYDDLIAAKRMTIAFTRGVVRRYNWDLTPNTRTYDMYRNDFSPAGGTALGYIGKPGSDDADALPASSSTLGASRFYVLNANYECFKCLYNGTGPGFLGGITATREPSRAAAGGGNGFYRASDGIYVENLQNTVDGNTDATAIEYKWGDFAAGGSGYVWKFMFKLPIDDVLRFLSTDFMPIPLSDAFNGSDRPTTEALAPTYNGAIQSVIVENATTTLADRNGINYYYAPVVGDGADAVVSFQVTGGLITTVKIEPAGAGSTVGGTGYTYGNVAFVTGLTAADPEWTGGFYGVYEAFDGNATFTIPAAPAAGETAALEPVIGPRGGHGSSRANGGEGMEREFNTKRVMANIRLAYNEGEGDFPVDNDFRRIGILKDPASVATPTGAIEETLTNVKKIGLTNGGGLNPYVVDETITQTLTTGGEAIGTVISWERIDANTGYVSYYQSPTQHKSQGKVRDFEDSTVVGVQAVTSTNGGNGLVDGSQFTNGLSGSEFIADTGDVIYLENRRLITRAPDQIEDIKLVIEF